jgi:hypothetical protein
MVTIFPELMEKVAARSERGKLTQHQRDRAALVMALAAIPGTAGIPAALVADKGTRARTFGGGLAGGMAGALPGLALSAGSKRGRLLGLALASTGSYVGSIAGARKGYLSKIRELNSRKKGSRP